MKPYYTDNYVTIYHGDCREILPTLPKVDLVLTDPPWNLGYFQDDNKHWDEYTDWLSQIKDVCLTKADIVWIFQSTKAVPYVAKLFEGWNMFASVKGFCQMTPKHIPNAFDVAFFNSHEKYKGNGRNWHLGHMNRGTGHPTARPEDTVIYILNMYDCNIILDPFVGSGTTLWCAKKLNRKSIGIEIEERYCEIAANRCRQMVFDLTV